jgi:hypothetical protein
VLKYIGNEYAQGIGIQGYGGEHIWVGNVYLPPATNLTTRGIDEDSARSEIEDIVGSIPPHHRSVMCGDWNARVGTLQPKIGEQYIARQSLDMKVCTRAQWVVELCE